MQKALNIEERQAYKIVCPSCGKHLLAHKSLAHEMGLLGLGHGTCLNCKKSMRIIYDPEQDAMQTKIWVNEKEGDEIEQADGAAPA